MLVGEVAAIYGMYRRCCDGIEPVGSTPVNLLCRTLSGHEATQILRDGRGEQWDAAIVDAFLRCIADRFDLVEMDDPSQSPTPIRAYGQPGASSLRRG